MGRLRGSNPVVRSSSVPARINFTQVLPIANLSHPSIVVIKENANSMLRGRVDRAHAALECAQLAIEDGRNRR